MKNEKQIIRCIAIVLIVLSLVLVILFFMNGSVARLTKTGDSESQNILICNADNYKYSFFNYINTDRSSIGIKMIFSDGIIRTIYLEYNLQYNAIDEANKSQDKNRIAMGLSFNGDGLAYNALSVRYFVNQTSFIMSIFSDYKELDDISKKYFLISDDFDINSSLSDYKDYYKNIAFECSDNIINI